MTDVPSAPFLGVECSLSGRRWRQRASDDRAGLALAQRHGLPEIIGRLLASRGVEVEEAERFLAPKLRESLPDPSGFRDMDKAVARIVRAVTHGEMIAVFGDYDVDGATSAALIQRFLAAVGVRVRVYIPDRLREGYGPNAPALLRLKEEGASVVITVDCGTTSVAPLTAAAEAGLDVIVVDHHVAEPALPPAFAVINPNRLDEATSYGVLAAVGVAFLLVVGVNRGLRLAGWYAQRPGPDLLQYLDLVALGTICDVVPLTGLNRALTAQGLKLLRRRGNVGLAALADVAGVGERLDAYHAGFILGPRVNAGGRVGRADLGARLLAGDDATEARAIAGELDALNAERREIEARVLAQAIDQVESGDRRAPFVFVAGEGWHPGVIGIVASRLRERYNRPACVTAVEGVIGKGSGRSVPGLPLGPAIIAARQAGLVVNGGGHAMAAGFTVETARLGALRDFLAERAGGVLGEDVLVPELRIDGMLAPGAATPELLELVERLGPFGTGNAEPRFALANLRVVKADVAAGQHVRCVLADGAGKARLKAVAFRSLESELGPALLNGQGRGFHVAGHLRPDNWQGRVDVQLVLDDASPAG
ncbi:MAG TPA: single-stranded-DNA-specific exonuclease RecJ [Stellaceae bacterium]|nr:single-stranded-DNA-specific exonuclease RecJ [Stellaceae bacterium]